MGVANWSELQRDEPLGVIALSGPVDARRLDEGLDTLRGWRRPVLLAPNLRRRTGYLAGSDDDRLGGLEWLLDRGVRTFIAARGGYGVTRLLDRMPWARLADVGARFVGFSDLTALINSLAGDAVQIHGAMVAAGLSRPDNAQRLHSLLVGEAGDPPLFRLRRGRVLHPGSAEGVARGGNLSTLVALMGTPWEVDLRGSVLMLEDVAEPPYRLDRMLTQLSACRGFGEISAIVAGRLCRCRPLAECRSVWRTRLAELAPVGVPVLTGLPFGHGADNRPFPIGGRIAVDSERGEVLWRA